MAEQIRWITGQASVPTCVERICPGKHIRSTQWEREWNHEYLNEHSKLYYDYISDYESVFRYPIGDMAPTGLWQELQEKKRQGTIVSIKNVAHYTNQLMKIINAGGFQGGPKKIDEKGRTDIKALFSWWDPVFTDGDKNQVRDHLGTVIRPFLGDNDDEDFLKNQFATSSPFRPSSRRYGKSFYFQYDINELCQEYRKCCRSELDFRILGTYGYKTEVMHAVLVCSAASGEGRFSAYPRVATPAEDTDNEAVVTRDRNGTWTWKPQATATQIIRLQGGPTFPKYRRWDHVAFAFHIPHERDVLQVRDLRTSFYYTED